MFDLVSLATTQLYPFILVLVRISGIFLFDPVYGSANIPAKLKICLAVALAAAVFPVVRSQVIIPEHRVLYALAVGRELLIGLALGYAVTLIFAAVESGGQLIGYSMGLSIANVFDPAYGSQVTVIARLKYLLALMVFLSLNGHHWILEAICRSYSLSGPLHYTPAVLQQLTALSAAVFETALRVSAPVVVTLIIVNAALGIIARTMPQMNVFIVGFPLQIGVGLIALSASLFLFVHVMERVFGSLRTDMYVLLRAFHG